MDDTQAARDAFEAWFARWPYPEARVYASNAWFAAIDYARPIPAAAALLRAAGWTVEEPKCRFCGGTGALFSSVQGVCSACNGTGARKSEGG